MNNNESKKYYHDYITPYNDNNLKKKDQIILMFDKISSKYDFINRLLSFRIDIYWRKKLISEFKKDSINKILDVATGTGDLAIRIAREIKQARIIGIDISLKMLQIAKKKIEKLKLDNKISTFLYDAENMPFSDGEFDVITVAFGVRNFASLDNGIKEMYRVLKKDGTLCVLEFSNSRKFLIKSLYKIYVKILVVKLGKWISKDQGAYKYLDISSEKFLTPEQFKDLLVKTGFKDIKIKYLTFGVCSICIAKK